MRDFLRFKKESLQAAGAGPPPDEAEIFRAYLETRGPEWSWSPALRFAVGVMRASESGHGLLALMMAQPEPRSDAAAAPGVAPREFDVQETLRCLSPPPAPVVPFPTGPHRKKRNDT